MAPEIMPKIIAGTALVRTLRRQFQGNKSFTAVCEAWLLDASNGAHRAQANNLPVALVLGEHIKGSRAEKFFI